MELGKDASLKTPIKDIIEKIKSRVKPVPEVSTTRADRLKAYEERINKSLKRRV